MIAESLTDPEPAYLELVQRCAREERRPWGHYEVLSDDKCDHKVKRITVEPGKRLSLQLHHRRAEHWLIVSGQARVTLGEAHHDLGPGQAIDIPVEAAHRIENLGTEPVVFIEVQQGSYFGEDDIVRLQDDFGRN
ncbi:MAG: Alginate biosynthesis protein AlgA [Deltaproteobacteria bacterium ADurb.Bin510]|nr:MAG: Alginate biosynthesis protein AlgA [Deltaproteobacteria bacterium ADurb.Bin510]